jgi:MFS family permease
VRGPARRFRLDRTRLLCVLLFCNTFGMGAFGPLLPKIGRTQALADWQLGMAAASFGFARMAAAMPTGAMVARRLSATLVAAPAVLIAGLLLVVNAGPFVFLLAGRFVLGVAHTLTMVAGLTAILLEDHRRGASLRLNTFEFSGMLGLLGGLCVVGVMPAALGWKVSLAVASTPALIPLFLASAMRRAFPKVPQAERGDAPADDRRTARRGDTGVVALMFSAGIIFGLSWSAVSAFVIPIRGAREFGLSRTGISWLLAMAQVIDLAVLIPVGRLADRVGRGLALGAVSVALGLGTLGVGLGSFPLFALGCACFGLGLGGWMLPLGVIREHTPVSRLPWRTGLYRVAVDSAIFLGPLVAGVLEGGGQQVFLAVIGGTALLLGARFIWRPSP